MSTRKRDRFKRAVLLLVALAVLAFLLEMNRFLPGTWPGGGGGGIKTASKAAGLPEPPKPPLDAEDPGTVAPPTQPPRNWPPPEGILVEVRGPDGSLETEWRLGSGSGKDEKPGPDGRLRTGDARAREKGFRIGAKAGKLRHEHGVSGRVAAWSVHLPAAELPKQRDGGRAGLKIVDAVRGTPIEGATVRWRVRGRKQSAVSDATGEAIVTPEYGGRAVRVRVSADGYLDRLVWASPRDARLRKVALAKIVSQRVKFVTAEGAMASIERMTVLAADGRRLVVPNAGARRDVAGGFSWIDAPETEAATAWVEVHQRRPDRSDWVFRLPFRDVEGEVAVPAHKALTVKVSDVDGEPVREASIWAEQDVGTERGAGSGGEGARNGVARATEMPARFDVLRDRPFKLRVEVPGKAPIVRTYTAMDGNAPLAFVVEDGLMIPVRLVTEEGVAVPLARVVARASVDGVRIVRQAKGSVDGRAEVGPFGPGPVEIFASANGRAWAATVTEAKAAMGTVELVLAPGYLVNLVVEDPFGVPLEGVDVEISPMKGPPLVSPPPPVARRTDAGGRLTIAHVPNGLYTVRLTREGHHAEVLRGVQPGAVTYFATLVPK